MATICKQLWTEGQTCMETDTPTCHQCVERTSGPKVVVDEDFFSGMGVLWKSCHFSLPCQEVWAAVLCLTALLAVLLSAAFLDVLLIDGSGLTEQHQILWQSERT